MATSSFWASQVFPKVGRQGEWRTIEQWLSRWSAQSNGPVLHREFARVCKVLDVCIATNSTPVSLSGASWAWWLKAV